MIQRVDREPALHELLGESDVVAAVRVEAVRYHDHRARGLTFRAPRPREDVETAGALEAIVFHLGIILSCTRRSGTCLGSFRARRAMTHPALPPLKTSGHTRS